MDSGKTPMDMKKAVRWEVFIPAYIVIAAAAIVGIVNKDMLTQACNMIFTWSLDTFGWLYQISIMACFVLVAAVPDLYRVAASSRQPEPGAHLLRDGGKPLCQFDRRGEIYQEGGQAALAAPR